MDFSKPDFIATVTYKTTEDGGIKKPVKSGYRPKIKFGFTDMQTAGQQVFDKDVKVAPGQTAEAKVKLLSPHLFERCLDEGLAFEFTDNNKVIGSGKIKKILNSRLKGTVPTPIEYEAILAKILYA